ncbi:MAG: TonB-dependent receptor [Pseudomonadota bacterium]
MRLIPNTVNNTITRFLVLSGYFAMLIMQRVAYGFVFVTASFGVHAQPSDADSVADEDYVEEMIVYGELRDRTVQDTYASVAITNEKALEERNMQNLEDVISRTPGVMQYDDGGFAIRGVSHLGTSGGTTFGSTLSVFLDGVRQTPDAIRRDPFNLFDAQQVEVFRGGQSTSRGGSAMVGTIEIRTNDPSFEREFSLQTGAKYGEQHSSFGYQVNGMVNQPLGENFAVRAVINRDDFDGYVINTTRDDFNNPEDRTNGRFKLLYATDDESIRAVTTFNSSETIEGNTYVLRPEFFPGAPPLTDRVRSVDVRERRENHVQSIAQSFDWTISDALSLRTTVTYLEEETFLLNDFDGTAAPGQTTATDTERENLTAEVLLSYEGLQQNFLVGFWSETQSFVSTAAVITDPAALVSFGLIPPAFLAFFPPEIIFDNLTDGDRQNYAVFGEYERNLTEALSLRVGLRVDSEDQDITAAADANTTLLPLILGETNGINDFVEFLPSLAATWRINEKNNLSLVYKEDYRAGGVALSIESGAFTYDPEFTRTVELAWRAEKLLDSINLMVNVFYTEWEDQQVSVREEGSNFNVIRNAGQSTQRGVEGSVDWQPTDSLNIYLSGAYNDSTFDDFDAGEIGDFTGNTFPFAPEWSGNLGLTWYARNNLSLDVNANYQDTSFPGADNVFENERNTVFNTSLRYDDGERYASLYVRNVTDEDFVVWDGQTVSFSAARTAGVLFGARF